MTIKLPHADVTLDDARWILEKLNELQPERCDDRGDWLRVGMALHHQFAASPEAFELWFDWSSVSDKFDPDICEAYWDGFQADQREDQVTIGSIKSWLGDLWRDYRAEKYPREVIPAPQEDAADEFEMFANTGEDLLAQLRTMSPDEVEAGWLPMVMDAGPIAEDAFLIEVARIIRSNKRALQKALRDARRQRAQAAYEQRLVERANRMVKARVFIQPGDPVQYARQVERLIVERAEALDRPESFVKFADRLCQVVPKAMPHAHEIDNETGPGPETYGIQKLSRTDIEERIAAVAQIERATENGPRVIDPDFGMVTRVLEIRDGTAPQISGLLTHPIVLQNGEILAENGLHAESRFVLVNAEVEGCRPYSRSEAAAALVRLRESAFDGFEFATPLDADVALAMLFTGVQRKRMALAPAFMVLAASQSSGKTTLARCVHVLLTGRDMSVFSMPRDEAEIEKRVFAVLTESPAMVCFDNVADGHFFHSQMIAAVLSSSEYIGRPLCESKTRTVPTASLFALTGNNLRQGQDEVTRWATIRLAPRGPNPEERRFRHPDVVTRMQQVRSEVLRDVVGVVSGYARAEKRVKPDRATRFHAWDRQVREALLWAGAGDVADVFRRNAEENSDGQARVVLLRALREQSAGEVFRTKDVRKWCSDADFTDDENLLNEALEQLGCNTREDRSIAAALQRMKDREIELDSNIWRLIAETKKDRENLARWRVVRVV